MNVILRGLPIALLASCLLLGCGDDLTSEDHLNNANLAVKEGKYQEAIIELKNSLRKDDSNANARATLGNLYFERGLFADADKELSRALSSGMDPATVIPILAQVLVGLGEFQRLDDLPVDGLDAESRSTLQAAQGVAKLYRNDQEGASELIEIAVQNEPSSPYAQVAAARMAMVEGEPKEARERLKAVFVIAPEYAPAWNLLGDIERAEKHLEAAKKAYSKAVQFSSNSFEPLLNRVMVRIELGDFKGAHYDLGNLQKTYGGLAKKHPGVQFARGLVFLQTKQIDKAKPAMEKAAEFSDNYPRSLYYLAVIYADEGLVEQALSNVNRFLSLAPENPEGSKLAARLELGKKNYRNAERLLVPVVAANKDDAEALNLLASARLSQGNSASGVDLLKKAVELQPNSKPAKARLGAAYLADGSEELGIKTLKEILAKDPKYDEADTLIVSYYIRQNQAKKAIRSAQQYVKRNPSAASNVLLARTYLVNNKTEKAKAAFMQALTLEPGDPVAGNSLAGYALLEKDYAGARKYYQQVLDHHPDNMETRIKVAAAFAMEGKDKEMLASLDDTMAAYPRAMEPKLVKARYYIAKGQMEKAIPLLESLSDKQEESPEALETQATLELATNRFNQAVSTIGKLVDTNPKNAEYHYMKSRAYAGLGDKQKLSSELDQTLALDPNHFNAKVASARLALLSDETLVFEDKLATLKKLAPQSSEVVQLEIAYAYKKGDYKLAEELLEGLFKREPNTTNAIALATLRQSVGDTKGAIAQLQAWIAKNTSDVKAREKLAEVYGSVNQVEDVMIQCREILKLEPDNIVALNNLAWYLLSEDPKQALAYAERAIALSPDSSPILDTLAMAQLKNNDLTEARRNIDRALAAAPKSADIRFHEARIRAAEGDRTGAIVTLNSLLKRDEDFSERQQAEAFLEELKSQEG